MNTHDDDVSPLASLDLHAWRVPPPRALDRDALLGRALAPQAVAPRVARSRWLLVGLVVVNAAIAALIAIAIRPAPPAPAAVALPAGGDIDARVRDVLARLERQQRDLEQKLAEITELRALVLDLSRKVDAYERADRERTVAPAREDRTRLVPDERPGGAGMFDRTVVSTTMGSLRPALRACQDSSHVVQGRVALRVTVAPDGSVRHLTVETEDAELRACVSRVMSTARFPRTASGGAFSFPLLFGTLRHDSR